jgi:hypothetical protein
MKFTKIVKAINTLKSFIELFILNKKISLR